MIRIFVLDDHAIIREGLQRIISKTNDIKIVGEAGDAKEIIKKVVNREWKVDIVLLDITLPGRSGIEVMNELKAIRPELRFLVLSIHPEDQYAIRALRSGASGYMTKDSAPEQLVGAIRKIFSGGKYISPSLAERLASYVRQDYDRPVHETLSNREFQVMCMIASGKTVSEIAKELTLSVKTISAYRSKVLEKMNMKTNAQLTLYVLQKKLTDWSAV
ncbi:MAG: response regulator [Fidelibacterota bacterium]